MATTFERMSGSVAGPMCPVRPRSLGTWKNLEKTVDLPLSEALIAGGIFSPAGNKWLGDENGGVWFVVSGGGHGRHGSGDFVVTCRDLVRHT